jgi:cytoskeletal protein RodZ
MSLGEFLQGARESAGLSIDELSDRTSIRAGLLREIENNNFIHCGADTCEISQPLFPLMRKP